MICKVCNATVDDTATACPFCGSPLTAGTGIDPGMSSPFPDPTTRPSGTVNLSKPSDQSQQNPYGQPQQNPYGQPQQNPYGQPQQNPYGQPQQNPYGQPQQNAYGQPAYQQNYDYNSAPNEYEQKVDTIWTLGLVGMILSIVIGFCCCFLPGPIVGIVGLVKSSGLKDCLYLLSEEKQKKLNTGKIFCIVAIAAGALALVVNVLIAIYSIANSENLK
ncbi:MAG: hypothetical protein K6F80_06995 [Oscillospiraceae bacterium]|nr:hypothetical protein [Oscillospiraceae bacterium]